ncbi:hypothetical protein BC941DRAFT_516975 [Chlamydoabsidia padenii]|nr:hypothetical protein BC941DRAFT_516975 [Chlamydoabsidia padenii]
MKVTWMVVGLLNVVTLVVGQSVAVSSASVAGSSSTPSLASPTTTPSIIEPSQSPSPLPQGPPILCSDQTVFELCLKNQENYIKACRVDEYACLCRWHSSKLSCYDNCPQDAGRLEQSRVVKDACSQPGANVTLPAQTWIPPSSSVLPSVTGSSPVSATASTNNNHKSSGNLLSPVSHYNDMCFLAIVLMLVGWMI